MPPATTSAQALQDVQTAQSQQQTPQQLQSAADSSMGVQGAQQQVSGLRQAITNTTNLLNGVAPSVEGRTANSLVTSAQANRQIQNESAPIAANLKSQSSDLTGAEANLNNLTTRADQQAALGESAQNAKLSNLESIYKDLYGQESAKAAGEAAAADAQQKAAEFQATLAEKTANDQATQANAATKASTPSSADQKQIDMGNTAQYLTSLKGGDGHVSQQTWNNAMQQWINAGYSAAEFVKNNMQFINQRYTGYHGFS